MENKPKVAFFDFACCEGCQLQIVNLEDQIIKLLDLIEIVEFREALTAKAEKYDIAFVEGSITREEDEKRVKDIRKRSKILVALGQCAVSGGINRLKNNWRKMDDIKKCVYGDHYNMPHLETSYTRGVDEVVKVDIRIPGCPINKDEFLRVVTDLVLGKKPVIPNYPVCVECKLRENGCLFDRDIMCMGPLAQAGCGAICPSNGSPCEACRGTVKNPNTQAMFEILEKYNYTVDEIRRKINIFGVNPEV